MGSIARALPRPRTPSLPDWPRLRRRLIALALVALALGAAYVLWLRDSSLVAVESVTINGAQGQPDAEAALRAAALEQSTLHVDLAALEEAVANDPYVRSVSATSDLPHGLTIDVELREPVGYLKSGGAVVADDGVVLERDGGRRAGVAAIALPGRDAGAISGGSATGPALKAARVLGAAPDPLLELVRRATLDPDLGVVLEIGSGLELRFGDAGEAEKKWRAAAAVLADPKLAGAAYLDLTVPGRPVVGGISESGSDADLSAAAGTVTPPPAAPAPVDPAAAGPAPATAPPAPGDPAATVPQATPVAPPTGAETGGGATLE